MDFSLLLHHALTLLIGAFIICALVVVVARLRWGWHPSALRLTALPILVVYAVFVIAVTLLPLPDKTTFTCGSPYFYPRFFVGWSVHFALQHNTSLVGAFLSKYTAQVLLNITLFIPLGAFLNWLFRLNFRAALLIGFACTLGIELTQLTGLWGYYDCAYRTFDAEDLLGNTCGAVLGWIAVEWTRRRVRGIKGLPNL